MSSKVLSDCYRKLSMSWHRGFITFASTHFNLKSAVCCKIGNKISICLLLWIANTYFVNYTLLINIMKTSMSAVDSYQGNHVLPLFLIIFNLGDPELTPGIIFSSTSFIISSKGSGSTGASLGIRVLSHPGFTLGVTRLFSMVVMYSQM